MEARWQRWSAQTRAWGPPGNERLTTSVGLVLLVLLGIETLTTLALELLSARAHLPGAAPDPACGAQAGQHRLAIRPLLHEQPAIPARGAAFGLSSAQSRVLVVSTLTLFGSGVALIVHGHGGGPLLQIHVVQLRGLGRADRNPYPRLSDWVLARARRISGVDAPGPVVRRRYGRACRLGAAEQEHRPQLGSQRGGPGCTPPLALVPASRQRPLRARRPGRA